MRQGHDAAGVFESSTLGNEVVGQCPEGEKQEREYGE